MAGDSSHCFGALAAAAALASPVQYREFSATQIYCLGSKDSSTEFLTPYALSSVAPGAISSGSIGAAGVPVTLVAGGIATGATFGAVVVATFCIGKDKEDSLLSTEYSAEFVSTGIDEFV